jgi:hypothetical protein
MTKEDIAKKYVPCRCDTAYTSRNLTAPDCPYHSTDPEAAMDEYAKQQAIAFDEWKWANRWHSLENGFWYQTLEHPSAMSDKTYNKYHRKTPQELYNQFIEQQNKDK